MREARRIILDYLVGESPNARCVMLPEAKTLVMKTLAAFGSPTRLMRSALGGAAALAVLTFASPDSCANPRFARETGKPCNFCHSGPPRLNDAGVAFKANGFQLPPDNDSPDKDHKVGPAQ
jgi:hypothetical protein